MLYKASIFLLFSFTGSVISSMIPPDTGKNWITLDNGVQFQPGDLDPNDPKVRAATEDARNRMLDSATNSGNTDNPYEQQFIDGDETYYDPYSQAWRLLGFYIDCNLLDGSIHSIYYNYYTNNADNHYYNPDFNEINLQACQRYLLWAAVSFFWLKTDNVDLHCISDFVLSIHHLSLLISTLTWITKEEELENISTTI